MAENNSKANSSSHHEEKDVVRAPNLIERAKEEADAVFHGGKSPKHDKETHGRSEEIDDETAIDDVRGPGVLGRVKEEIEAVAGALIHKNRKCDSIKKIDCEGETALEERGVQPLASWQTGAETSHTNLNFNKGIGEEFKGVSSKIGSSPPSCEHKCYGCMPCEAIQVPTITSRVGVQYANYEPEGWKCKCGPRLYSP